ncbi:hypothetical protein [Bradyrhizobium sp. JR3.5]
MKADWKTANDLREDVKRGTGLDLGPLLIDLWERVDELQRERAAARARIERLEHAADVSGAPDPEDRSGL